MAKKETTTMTVEPIEATMSSPLVIPPVDDVEEAVVLEETTEEPESHFIESNTQPITLEELSEKNIVPTFGDGTVSTSHQSFIESVLEAGRTVFGDLSPVDIRVSHPINGRVPSALHKKANELLEEDKTLYWQRMGFVSHVVGLTRSINGQTVHLCIGGVRAYNEDKLYGKQSPMKFKIFVGWQVRVCSNLMLTCDGNSGTIECMTEADILQRASELFSSFEPNKENALHLLENLQTTVLTEEQFCKIVGRLRLYQFLPAAEQKQLPSFDIGDQAVNAMVKGYVNNPNFGKKEGQDITCWNLLQLATEAVKSAYIDRFVSRNNACVDFSCGIQKALNGEDTEGYSWFLS